jgi:hypothetical protein
MLEPWFGSPLRRLCASTGVVVALCVLLALPAFGAAPAPDPPPLSVAPEPQPEQPAPAPVVRQAPVVTPRVVTQTPLVRTSTPAVVVPVQRAKTKPKAAAPVKVARVVKPKAQTPVARPPHDRNKVPLAAFVPSVDSIDRDLLALAGFGLLLVAVGGAVVLFAARRQLALAALGLLVLVGPVTNASAAAVSYTLVGTAGTNGWHTSDVTIKWTVDPTDLVSAPTCPAAELITSEGSTTRQCTATYIGGFTVSSPVVTIKIDKSAPSVSGASLARAPDSNGWFNHSVAAAFSGQDGVSGIAGCSSPTYAGADSASASLSGTCSDLAGNSSAPANVGFKYDATPPAVVASPDRKPDAKGWYRKPLTVTFAGTDATSGIAACTAPTRYAGPDLPKAAVVGSCRDAAGNSAEAGQAFQYDATAPKLPVAKVEVQKGVARIVWKRSPDAVLVELERAPGVNGRKKTIVYQGNGASFTDRTVRDGVRYRYEIRASDAAGNMVQKAVTANVDLPALYRPAAGAAVHAPLVLAWEAVKGASFYNIQLYRNKVKVLTFWPKEPTFRVGKTWRYEGKVHRLVSGKYDWYVWGARGTRAKPQYGKLLGSSSFVVR